MFYPTMNVILFVEDLLRYVMEENGIQWNLPFDLSSHRHALDTYFNPRIGQVVVHSEMVSRVESYAGEQDFCYQEYLESSETKAFEMLLNLCENLSVERNGLIEVCTLAVEIYFLCHENQMCLRAYETICTFIYFLLMRNICNELGRRRMDHMVENINREFDIIAD